MDLQYRHGQKKKNGEMIISNLHLPKWILEKRKYFYRKHNRWAFSPKILMAFK